MTALIRYEAARSALAAAHSLDEVKDIRDKSEAMAAYARQAKDTELIAWATEIKVRAERRAGEMLVAAKDSKELRGRGNPQLSTASTIGLEDLGISRDQSSRWQRMAAMPADQFEVVVETSKAQVGEVTSAVVLREAKRLEQPAKPKAERPARQQAAAAVPEPATTDVERRKTKGGRRAADPEAERIAEEAHGDFDPLRELEQAHIELERMADLVRAAEADDQKAETIKWRKAVEAANRTASEKMDAAARMDRDLTWYARQLDRCGKAVGQTDRTKIAAAVEAFARQQAAA